jgi:Carboxypeptidase regulatory-like domain
MKLKSIKQEIARIGQYGRTISGRWRTPAYLVVLLVLITTAAFAQLTTADILGTVTDPSGAVVPNATIILTNLGTNEVRTTQSSNSGDYTFSLLPVGHYSVSVKAAGFQTSITKDLSVEAGDRARNDVRLETGSEATTIEVQATTPLLQADSATVSSTVTAQAVQDLPLNGRNFVQLVQIVPGANEGPGNGLTSGARPDDRRQSASFSVNGQDDTLNNYTIDGIDDNERIIGTIGVRPVVEAIQEITVQTNNYTAEAGRTAGGVVSVVTRAGTNQFHGSAYEFFRNDIFDARNVLQTSGKKPELRQNQFGGSIGGPIWRDRTFFFGDYEGFRAVTGVTYTKTTLTQNEYNDVNSLNGGSPQTLLLAGNGTAPGGQPLPVDPIALAYLKLYPAPNAGAPGALTNNYITSPNKTQFSNSFDVRVDHRFSANNSFFGRYDYNKVDTFTPPGLGTNAATGLQISGGQFDFDGPATDTAQQYGFGFTHIFTPNLLVDLRAAFTRINNLSLPLNSSATSPADAIVQGNNPGTFAANLNSQSLNLTPIGFPGLSDIGDGSFVPLQDIDNTFQYLGTVSWTRGNQNLRIGVSFIRRQARNTQSPYVAGQYTFGLNTDSSAPTGAAPLSATQQRDNGVASALTGAFSGEQRQVDITAPDYRTYEPSFFVQDSWKISPRLTVLYGVRYDVFTPFTEAHNRIANFNFVQALSLTPATVSSALKIANVNGVDGHAGIATDYSNVAPRIGFSYSIDPQTVIRGGFGISYFPGNYTSNTDLKNVPFLSNFQPSCQSAVAVQIETNFAGRNTGNAQCAPAYSSFAQGLPIPAAPDVSNLQNLNPLSFGAESPNFKSGVIDQYNLQVERQFGPNVITIGYVGNVGHHLPQIINDINQPAPYSTNPNSPFYFGLLPNPAGRQNSGPRRLDAQFPGANLSGVGLVQSEGISNYNGLQTSIQRRFSKGLSFDANYTWSKALSDNNGFSQEGDQEGFSDADPFHIRQTEYGIAENDIQNRFALSANYEFQYGKEFSGLKKLALAGYHINTIAVWQSGKPFTILNGGGNNDNTTFVDPVSGQTISEAYGNRTVPNNGGGRDRPNQIANPRGNRSLHQFFNTAAFAPQPTGTIGSTPRNSLFGPNYRHVDLSLFKDFTVTERVNLQFRAESYNVSNTPSYIIPLGSGNAQLGNPAFGTVTNFDPNYNPRLYQFALKAQF